MTKTEKLLEAATNLCAGSGSLYLRLDALQNAVDDFNDYDRVIGYVVKSGKKYSEGNGGGFSTRKHAWVCPADDRKWACDHARAMRTYEGRENSRVVRLVRK